MAELDTRTATTLTAVLDLRASRRPERVVYTFLRDGGVESGSLTFAGLQRRALALAARFTSLGAQGDRATLLYPQGVDFLVAFFGCLYAGVIAVPVGTPSRKQGFDVLRRIVVDSGAKWILSTGPLLAQFREESAADPTFRAMTSVDTEAVVDAEMTHRTLPRVDPVHVALLQYTSGSTGTPRGVAVTHANLVANQRHIELGLGQDENDVWVSWLPMFHDMGLGSVLQAIWIGGRCVMMSPAAFLQKPARWLKAISHYRGTCSGGPDFAFDLCARRIGRDVRSELDLTSWRVAYNGSEPVRVATIDRFSETFADCGFRREAFHPVYGLAEATLLVSCEAPEEPPFFQSFSTAALELGRGEPVPEAVGGRLLVSCGHPWPGTEMAIVDPATREALEPGRVGEIWIRGATVAAGYWAKDAETEATFRATKANGEGPFLRTGDLGFTHGGHLFVTGRHKDIIIIRGRNHYPQDIEASVSACHPALVPLGCAAFSIDAMEGEALVIVQEVARAALRTLAASEVIRSIRRAVSEDHALHTQAVVLVRPATLPRTSSGKVQHAACARAFRDKSLLAIASWTGPTMTEPDTDADPDSERREVSARADRLIDWLRRSAPDIIGSYANAGGRVVCADLLRDLARQGLLGIQVEPKYGGLGLSHFDTARVIEQVAAFDFALALSVGFNNYLGIQPVAKYAATDIKALLLPGLAHGRDLAAFAFQEPAGIKPQSVLSAHARSDGEEHWRLFGTKYLDGVSASPGVVNVFARHDEPPGISAFVLSEGTEGFRRVSDGLSAGILGFNRETIALEGARVGRESLLGSLGSGMDIAREAMMHTRLAIAAACVGGMKRCAQLVSREGAYPEGTFDGNLTPNPLTLSRLGSLTARIDALECLVHRTARAIDAGHAVPSEAFAACRILGPELLLRSIDDLMQLDWSAGHAQTDRVLCAYRDAGLLRHFDGHPLALAEHTGAVVMEGDAALRVLVRDVLCSPDVVQLIRPAMDAIRERMVHLDGPLARRAQRWGHTRAGELTTWLVLLAAVDGSRRAAASPELARAHAWARAHYDYALSAIRSGTPAERATLDTADIAATFATYSRAIGAHDAESMGRDDGAPEPLSWDPFGPPLAASVTARAGASDESAQRELRSWIISWLAARLQIPVSEVEAGRSFADHGLDSVASVELAKALSDNIDRPLDETLLWNFPTIESLISYLVESTETATESASGPEEAPAPGPAASAVESQLDDEITRLERELRTRS